MHDRRSLALASILLATACGNAEGPGPVVLFDLDGDGVPAPQDCDDRDPTVRPGAVERCDGLDNNCDGVVFGEGPDLDGDGLRACDGDCDDTDPAVYPGATELCDGRNSSCAELLPAPERDADGDGVRLCDAVPDCDDDDPAVYPGAEELCDGADSDCDGTLPADEADIDGDGSAPCEGDCDDEDPSLGPEAPELCNGIDDDCDGLLGSEERDQDGDGFVPCDGGDCDDSEPEAWPGRIELCDGIDNDCNTLVDEGFDLDQDGFRTCDGDCNDLSWAQRPGAWETCNGVDDDCDGSVDEGHDVDGDGFTTCGGDCHDLDPERNPGEVETCDGIDSDCDGVVAQEALDADGLPLLEEDEDGDGWSSCEGECDDLDAGRNPGLPDDPGVVDFDDDCDGIPDNPDPVLVVVEPAGPAICGQVTLDASASTHPSGAPLEFLWTLDSAPWSAPYPWPQPVPSDGAVSTLDASEPGLWIASVELWAGNSAVLTQSLELDVVARPDNEAPTAVAGEDVEVENPLSCSPGPTGPVCGQCWTEVALDASGSSDADGDELVFSWTLLGPAGWITGTDGSTATLVLLLATSGPGLYTQNAEVLLTAADCSGGSSTDVVEVTLNCTAS